MLFFKSSISNDDHVVNGTKIFRNHFKDITLEKVNNKTNEENENLVTLDFYPTLNQFIDEKKGWSRTSVLKEEEIFKIM